MTDEVDRPAHYTFGTIEVLDVIEDWNLGWAKSCAIKYIARAHLKGKEAQDIKKAIWYLQHYLDGLAVPYDPVADELNKTVLEGTDQYYPKEVFDKKVCRHEGCVEHTMKGFLVCSFHFYFPNKRKGQCRTADCDGNGKETGAGYCNKCYGE